MRIVNPRRFTIACIIFVMLLGGLGYGIYRGGVWIWGVVAAQLDKETEVVEPAPQELAVSNQVILPVESEVNPLLEELEWMARFVVGCESMILYEDGVASITFEVMPKYALNYYPRNEITSRIYKQSLKVLQDVSKMEHVTDLKRLDVLYVDSRFETSENPVGEVMSLSFDESAIHQNNWESTSWLDMESYKSE